MMLHIMHVHAVRNTEHIDFVALYESELLQWRRAGWSLTIL